MTRFWWWLRIGLLTLVMMGLGMYLVATTPWRKWLGVSPSYAAQVAAGDRIVAAIYRFKAERGLWPEYLEDLAPAYLEKTPGREWFYEVTPVGVEKGGVGKGARVLPALSTGAFLEGAPHWHLGFDFDPKRPAWRVFGESPGQERVVRAGLPAGVIGAVPALEGKRAGAALAELDRRMQREPGVIEHWEGKAGLLVLLGRTAEARGVVDETRANFPESAWSRVAEITLDMEKNGGAAAEIEGFAAWVRGHPSMTRWYAVAWLFRRWGGHEVLAADAMREAVGQAIEVDADDRDVAAYYLWDMGRWAVAQKQWDLARAITDAWEKAEGEGKVHEKSYLALRAAARLAVGDIAGAKTDVEAAKKEEGRMWAGNLPALEAAVERGDRAFQYEPGNLPGEWRVFEEPE